MYIVHSILCIYLCIYISTGINVRIYISLYLCVYVLAVVAWFYCYIALFADWLLAAAVRSRTSTRGVSPRSRPLEMDETQETPL